MNIFERFSCKWSLTWKLGFYAYFKYIFSNLSVCLSLSQKKSNGWTDQAQGKVWFGNVRKLKILPPKIMAALRATVDS